MNTKKTEALKLALEALESCSAGDYSTGHVIHPSFDVDAVNRAIEAIDALAHAPTEREQPAQHERVQPDSECKEDDGCPTEIAVLQRFWRGEPIPTEHYPAWFRPAQQQERAMKVEGPLHVVCQCDRCKAQELVSWRNAALRVGEDLCSVGPFGYYDMTAEQWLDWALSVVTVHAPPTAQQQEPVAYASDVEFDDETEIIPAEHKGKLGTAGLRIPLYIDPPASKPWVGLTDEEFQWIYDNGRTPAGMIEMAEAKLKEKNT